MKRKRIAAVIIIPIVLIPVLAIVLLYKIPETKVAESLIQPLCQSSKQRSFDTTLFTPSVSEADILAAFETVENCEELVVGNGLEVLLYSEEYFGQIENGYKYSISNENTVYEFTIESSSDSLQVTNITKIPIFE